MQRLPTPESRNPTYAPSACPQCGGSVVDVQGLVACHDCDWTR